MSLLPHAMRHRGLGAENGEHSPIPTNGATFLPSETVRTNHIPERGWLTRDSSKIIDR